MCVDVSACTYLCAPLTCVVLIDVRSGHWTPRCAVVDSYEAPCRGWELNLDPPP